MFPLPAGLIALLEVAVPAATALIVGAMVGHRSVRELREKTGDKSMLTGVLSGESFRPGKDHPRKAA